MVSKAANGEARCQVCGRADAAVLRRAEVVRPAVRAVAEADGRNWDDHGWICLDDLQGYQLRYVQSLLESEKGELTDLELEVVRGLREQEIFSKNPEAEVETDRTFGQRLADWIATFGGSWTFIIVFGVVLIAWMALNSY